jgi:hypothetical protein
MPVDTLLRDREAVGSEGGGRAASRADAACAAFCWHASSRSAASARTRGTKTRTRMGFGAPFLKERRLFS